MNEYGTMVDDSTLRFERLLPGPIERVWSYLTDPEKRGTWLASGPMELRVGGKVELHFKHADLSHEKSAPARFKKYEAGVSQTGVVTRCDPPRVISFTWGDDPDPNKASEVTFELSPRGNDKVLLIVTHGRMSDRKRQVMASGGWHAHLGVLEDQLASREPRPFWTTFERLEREYAGRLGGEVRR